MNILKKTTVYIIMFLLFGTNIFYVAAETSQRQGNPMQMLDNFAHDVNEWSRIQENALNDITDLQWQYEARYKISNTLDSIRMQMAPYIQRTMYIGLSMAVLAIIYNGFLMVTNSVHGNWTSEKVKGRIISICIGVWLLTWFYVIIQLLLATISYVLQ